MNVSKKNPSYDIEITRETAIICIDRYSDRSE